MRLRKIPELNFIYDDTEIKAREMDRLLDKVADLETKRAIGIKGNNERQEA